MSPLDELGLAIANAGYTWTPEMRKAYEKGVRKQKKEWVGLTEKDLKVFNDDVRFWARYWEAKLKEKNCRD